MSSPRLRSSNTLKCDEPLTRTQLNCSHQARVTRVLTGYRTVPQAPYSASATELRQQLHWLPIRQRIIYKLAVITDKTRSSGTPAYLSQLIHHPGLPVSINHHYQPTRTLRSSDKLLLFVPKTTLALSAKAFTVSTPSIWNSLSYKCQSAELLSTFKRTL